MTPELIDREVSAMDDALRKEGVPVPLRMFAVVARLSGKLQRTINIDDAVAAAVDRWYETRYGARACGVGILGRFPILLSGEPFAGRILPRIKSCSGGLQHTYDWAIEGGTEPRLDVPLREAADVNDMIRAAYRCHAELSSTFTERVLPAEATLDIDAAVDELVRTEGPRAGLSKWASLQLAEKCMKAFLRSRGVTPPFTHDLADLNKRCVDAGMADFSGVVFRGESIVHRAQCDARARYDGVVSVEVAVESFYAALSIAAVVAGKLRVEAGKQRWLDLPPKEATVFVIARIAAKAGVQMGECAGSSSRGAPRLQR